MVWQVPKIWDGEDVWILGGGPSITKQFEIPDNIVQDVVAGRSSPSVYSPFMECIHDKHVIGINVSYLIGNWIDMMFFGDIGFLLAQMQNLSKFPGLKVSCHPQTAQYNWIKFLPHDKQHRVGISSNPKAVCWNANSGAASISVAANAGAKRIFLLGFDMKLNETQNQHWHDLYKRHGIKRNKPFTYPFKKHLQGFAQILKDAQVRGISIINVNPDSAIPEFPKVTLKEVV